MKYQLKFISTTQFFNSEITNQREMVKKLNLLLIGTDANYYQDAIEIIINFCHSSHIACDMTKAAGVDKEEGTYVTLNKKHKYILVLYLEN